MVRTAIRACRALTGIDLSGCTQWHRFLEIHYRRQETHTKPARTETTVIFLPDVWSVMPTASEFPQLEKEYADALEVKLHPELVKPKEEEEAKKEGSEPMVKGKQIRNVFSAFNLVGFFWYHLKETTDSKTDDSEEPAEATDEANNEAVAEEGSGEEGGRKPTPWSDLDVKSMKVNELREELDARGLNSKGLKSQLAGRLQKALKEEQEAAAEAEAAKEQSEAAAAAEEEEKEEKGKAAEGEDGAEKAGEEASSAAEGKETKEDAEMEVVEVKKKEGGGEEVEEVRKEEEQPKPLDEKQKSALRSAYKFPTSPCGLVHPNPKAKSGKFDCATMSLSLLLDYRSDDNKEGTFEVSLFAELFNEMLSRDAGFRLYRAVMDAPTEKAREEKKERKEKEEKEKEKEGGDDGGSSAADTPASAEESPAATPSLSSKKSDDDGAGTGKKKMVTVDKDLLLACSYFDLSHSGYFETKDLEDIISTASLNLSRAQIKKLVSKVCLFFNCV